MKQTLIFCMSLFLLGGVRGQGSLSSEIRSFVDSADYLYFSEQYPAILPLGKRALTTYYEGIQKSEIDLANIYIMLAEGYFYIGNLDSLLHYCQGAITLLEGREEGFALAKAYRLQGKYHRSIADHEEGFRYQEKALGSAIRELGSASPHLARFHHEMGIEHLMRFDNPNALEYMKKAMWGYQQRFGPNHLVNIYINTDIGIVYRELMEYEQALLYFHKAIDISKVVGQQNISTITAYGEIGELYKRKGQCAKAIPYYDRALELTKEGGMTRAPKLAADYGRMMVCQYFVGNFEQGDAYFYLALDLLDYSPQTPEKFSQVNDLMVLNFLFFGRTTGYLDHYQSTKQPALLDTLRELNRLVLDLEDYFQEHSSAPGQTTHFGAAPYVYESAIFTELHHRNKSEFQAFILAERAKGRQLLANARLSEAVHFAGISPKLLERGEQLNADLVRFEKALYYEEEKVDPDETVLRAYKDTLFDLRRQKTDFVEALEKDFPEYYRLKYNNQVLDVPAIQEGLSPGEAVIEYFIGDSIARSPQIYIFMITRDQFLVELVPLDFPLKEWVQQLREGIYGFWSVPGQADSTYIRNERRFCQTSHALYRKLLAPVADFLPPRLLIIPHGILYLLPFDVLLKERAVEETPLADRQYVVKDHIISYDYSATLHWGQTSSGGRRPKKFLAGFAPEFRADEDSVYLDKVVQNARRALSPLQFNQKEIAQLSEFASSDLFFGEKAAKEVFLQKAGDYQVLHLATHSKVDDQVGDFSFIAFSNDQDSLTSKNLLYLRELYDLSLQADLVVLSACETGLGKLRQGEGLISISRGFLYAGAKSTLTTLWSIQDHPATLSFMKTFYGKLKEGMTKDEALQAAKLKSLDDPTTAHPFFWAGFVPVGDMAPVRFPRWLSPPYWIYLLAGGALAILWRAYTLSKKRKATPVR